MPPPDAAPQLSVAAAVALASLFVTLIAGFGKIIRQLSRMEVRLEILWGDYVARDGTLRVDGRRRTDPPPHGRG